MGPPKKSLDLWGYLGIIESEDEKEQFDFSIIDEELLEKYAQFKI